MKNLLSIGNDAKTIKGEKRGYLTGIMYLAPSNESAVINTCPMASKGCRMACLFTAGRGGFNSVRQARIDKTLRFARDRENFMNELARDIQKLAERARKRRMTPCVRLNGTSDITWEKQPVNGKANLMEAFPEIQFYDYTAIPSRAEAWAKRELPVNYHVTFSRKESNQPAVAKVLEAGGNVSVVFAGELPKEWEGKSVINGDESDLRFLDPKGVIVGLKAKGKGKADASGFVVAA
jgi:hypothetical protein